MGRWVGVWYRPRWEKNREEREQESVREDMRGIEKKRAEEECFKIAGCCA